MNATGKWQVCKRTLAVRCKRPPSPPANPDQQQQRAGRAVHSAQAIRQAISRWR